MRQFEAAIETCGQLAHSFPTYAFLKPQTTLKNFNPSIGTAAFDSKMQRVLEGLRLAGLPE
jgi:hypothetical protein